MEDKERTEEEAFYKLRIDKLGYDKLVIHEGEANCYKCHNAVKNGERAAFTYFKDRPRFFYCYACYLNRVRRCPNCIVTQIDGKRDICDHCGIIRILKKASKPGFLRRLAHHIGSFLLSCLMAMAVLSFMHMIKLCFKYVWLLPVFTLLKL